MPRPALELADILRRFGDGYRRAHRLPPHHLRLMDAIETCRTAALGGHVDKCDHCSYTRISYNSCNNRHCPKCQSMARARWLQRRNAELLPIPYFHVVFTIPESVAPIALHNKKLVYDILFRTSSETLLTIARDPRHLGAEIGFFSILHTWGQNLLHHPHLHCVVPAGGLSADSQRWVHCRTGFFLSVRVLSRLFRRLFLAALEQAFQAGRLRFFATTEAFAAPHAFARLIAAARRTEWVVYAKPPFGGPAQVLEYLGRYTHRVAISNRRLVAIDGERVSFVWKDYRQHNKQKLMTVSGEEFIRRFLLHALPRGFQRIRHYGLLANRHRRHKLQLCRRLLACPVMDFLPVPDHSGYREFFLALTSRDLLRCPQCDAGTMVGVEILPRCRSRDPVLVRAS